jgi:ABC-2 type transport system ATP-binding protein
MSALTIEKGMFGLLGPNGAGKSSLMRTLATYRKLTAALSLWEISMYSNKKTSVRKVLGYLPQEFGVYPRTSALISTSFGNP